MNLRFTIPPFRSILRRFLKWTRSVYRAVYYSVYPFATPPAFIGITSSIVFLVLKSPSDSWIRSGPLANFIWNYGTRILPKTPLPMLTPHQNTLAKVGFLTAMTSSAAIVTLASLQRGFLKLLLKDKTFIYQSRRPTFYVKVWGFLVHMLTRGTPLTYSFQSCLPSLPVPSLKDTVSKYLDSAKLIQDPEQFEETKKSAEEFLKGPGRRLNTLLKLKSLFVPNYITDWWEKYVYLKGRDSIAINSNYYILDSGRWNPTHIPESRAACLLYSFMRFKEKLAREEIRPISIPPIGVPLCMWQYERMFATSRIPRAEVDEIKHYDPTEIRHVVVSCKGSYYKVYLYKRDGTLRPTWEIETMLMEIRKDATMREEAGLVRPAEMSLPSVTAERRDKWAAIREKHFLDSNINRSSLKDIESALIWVSLEDSETDLLDWTNRGKSLIHGNPDRPNVWFDKSISMVVFTNGKVGLNCEHSWADAPVLAHLMEEAHIIAEGVDDVVDGVMYENEGPRKGRVAIPAGADVSAASEIGDERSWGRLTFSFSVDAEKDIFDAHKNLRQMVDNFDLVVVSHDAYGKDFIKRCSVSPDAYIQMAMQLAYYRDQGRFDATYEASMTRLFLHGRTETVRPVTDESCNFVMTMLDENATSEDKLKALQRASARHVRGYQDAMAGRGIDRHLFGLFCAAVALGVDSPFLRTAILSAPWKLSTSQQPQQQTTAWNIRDPRYANRISPGGGFGPVAKDGYGVSYMVSGEKEIFFHISCLKDADNTDASRFRDRIFEALSEMRDVMAPVLEERTKAIKK